MFEVLKDGLENWKGRRGQTFEKSTFLYLCEIRILLETDRKQNEKITQKDLRERTRPFMTVKDEKERVESFFRLNFFFCFIIFFFG